MAIVEFKKVLAAYVFLKQTSGQRSWSGERFSIPNCCKT